LQRLYHQDNKEEAGVVVEVSRDLEKNQPKTLSEEFASIMEERQLLKFRTKLKVALSSKK